MQVVIFEKSKIQKMEILFHLIDLYFIFAGKKLPEP